jgi:hypothetical protein
LNVATRCGVGVFDGAIGRQPTHVGPAPIFSVKRVIDIGIDHLVNALKQAFALSDNERRIMGEKSREYIKRYNWNIIAHNMRLTYLWTLKKIKKPSFIELG